MAERVKEISASASHKPFVVIALGVPYLVNIAVTGDSAKATAIVKNQPVELEMAKAENGWKIIRYRDDALVQRSIDQVIKDLPAIGVGAEGKKTGKSLKGLPALKIR